MFSILTSKIFGATSLALMAALAFVMWRADSLSERLEVASQWQADVTASTRLASGVDKLAPKDVPEQIAFLGEGIKTLTATINTLNVEANARADAYEKAQQDALQDAERLNRQAKASQGQIDRLRALGTSGGQGCEVSEELTLLLEGL